MISNVSQVHHQPPSWRTPGHGKLLFRAGNGKTVVESAEATSPLRLLLPKNHGAFAWAFLSTFGGGMVDGDQISLDVSVGADAGALISTQASNKIYRSPRLGCRQQLHADVGVGATLVMLPDPVVVFAEGKYVQDAWIEMADGASVLLVDMFTAGRVAHGERWAFDGLKLRTRVSRNGKGILHDAIELDASAGPIGRRMGRFDAYATIMALGPICGALAHDLNTDREPLQRRSSLVAAASPVAGEGVVLRVAATSVSLVLEAVRKRLRGVANVVGDDLFARKW